MSSSVVPASQAALDQSTEYAYRHPRSPGWYERQVIRHLHRLRHGRIALRTPEHVYEFGQETDSDLTARITFDDNRCFRDIVSRGALGAAEAYITNRWNTNDLTRLLRIFSRQINQSYLTGSVQALIASCLTRVHNWRARNSPAGSRRNIAAHYDLGNDFFELFLDPTMMYSSAMFESDEQTLEQASLAKLDRICRALDLRPEDHVIEIGAGWGGFALHAARNYGCRVTTTTISAKQFELVRRRVNGDGLSDQIDVRRQDYRELDGRFDKLVSIEMIEAVGHDFLPVYFRTCDRLLKPGGRMLIQAITIPQQRYKEYRRGTDFIRTYIFPGGHLPSVDAMQQAVADHTRLQFTEATTFPDCYARTLREWRRRFLDRLDEVRQQGFDERFIRMWEYYLCYCEAAFLERAISVGHFTWEKPRF